MLAHYVAAVLAPNRSYARIRELVTSAGYLAAKARRVGPQELIEDVRAARRLAPDKNSAGQLRQLEVALARSARLVADDTGKLYGQLLARIPRGTASDIDKMLDEAAEWRGDTWLHPLSTVHGQLHIRSFGPVKGFIDAVAISDDSAVILAGDRGGGLSAWNTETGEQLWLGSCGSAVNAVAFRPASFDAVVALSDGTVAHWSLANRRVRPFAGALRKSAEALAVNAHRILYCAGSSIYAYDLESDKPIWSGEQGQDELIGVAILEDGERCVSVSVENALNVWRMGDGQFLCTVSLPVDQALCVAAIPERPLVAIGTRNGRLIIVDVDLGSATILRGHSNQVRSVAALHDGRVLSGSYDGQMLVWDLEIRASVGSGDTTTGVWPYQHHVDPALWLADQMTAWCASGMSTAPRCRLLKRTRWTCAHSSSEKGRRMEPSTASLPDSTLPPA